MDLGEVVLQRDRPAPGLGEALALADRKGLDEAADDVVALALDDEVAVRLDGVGLAVGGPRQHHARPRARAQVAEDHRLDDHGRAPVVGDLELAPVEMRPLRPPRGVDALHAREQLLEGVVDDAQAGGVQEAAVVEGQLGHLVRGEPGLLGHRAAPLGVAHERVEQIPFQAVAHPPELEEAPVGVPRGPGPLGLRGQARGHLGVDPDVEEGLEHAGHADRRPAPDREQEGPVRIAQPRAGGPLDPVHLRADAAAHAPARRWSGGTSSPGRGHRSVVRTNPAGTRKPISMRWVSMNALLPRDTIPRRAAAGPPRVRTLRDGSGWRSGGRTRPAARTCSPRACSTRPTSRSRRCSPKLSAIRSRKNVSACQQDRLVLGARPAR